MFRSRRGKALAVVASIAAVIVLHLAALDALAAAPQPVLARPVAAGYSARPSYCAPLVVARKLAPPLSSLSPWPTTTGDNYAMLLQRVARAAAADGRKDVVVLFDTTANALLTGVYSEEEYARTSAQLRALAAIAHPTVIRDCGSQSVPSAPPKLPSRSPTTATPARTAARTPTPDARPAYCAPLAEAQRQAPADPRQAPVGASYARLLQQVAAAASADGRGNVADLFDAAGGALHQPPSQAQVAGIMALRAKAAPTMAKDCR
jgi:hypothetical protein